MKFIRNYKWFWIGIVVWITGATLTEAATFLALRVSTPLIVSASAGIRFGDEAEEGFQPVAEVEAGVGGGKILLGLDSLGNGFGLGIKAVFLQTWFESINVSSDQSFLGLEFQIGVDRFFAEIGGFANIEGDDDEWISTLGLGFRL